MKEDFQKILNMDFRYQYIFDRKMDQLSRWYAFPFIDKVPAFFDFFSNIDNEKLFHTLQNPELTEDAEDFPLFLLEVYACYYLYMNSHFRMPRDFTDKYKQTFREKYGENYGFLSIFQAPSLKEFNKNQTKEPFYKDIVAGSFTDTKLYKKYLEVQERIIKEGVSGTILTHEKRIELEEFDKKYSLQESFLSPVTNITYPQNDYNKKKFTLTEVAETLNLFNITDTQKWEKIVKEYTNLLNLCNDSKRVAEKLKGFSFELKENRNLDVINSLFLLLAKKH